MSINPESSSDQDKIRRKLIEVAKSPDVNRRLISYSELFEPHGLDMGDPGHRNIVAAILDKISRKEHEEGRPLLSAVAVHKENGIYTRPGDGFYSMAIDLRKIGGGKISDEQKDVLFVQCAKEVYEYWKNHEPD